MGEMAEEAESTKGLQSPSQSAARNTPVERFCLSAKSTDIELNAPGGGHEIDPRGTMLAVRWTMVFLRPGSVRANLALICSAKHT